MNDILPPALQDIVWDYATSLNSYVTEYCPFDWKSVHEYFCYFMIRYAKSGHLSTSNLICTTRCIEQLLFNQPSIFRHDTTFGIMAHVIELSTSYRGPVILYMLAPRHRDLIWTVYEMVSVSMLFRDTRIPVLTFIHAVSRLHHVLTCYDIVRWLYHLNPNFKCI